MKFGKVEDLILKWNQHLNESKGFGYCKFQDYSSKEKCLATIHKIDGRKFDCKSAIPIVELRKKQTEDTERKIFVSGLKDTWKEKDLTKYFKRFGDVETSYIACEKGTEKSRKFGFVFFKEDSTVQKVMDVKKHYIQSCLINVKHLMPRCVDSNKSKKSKFSKFLIVT